MTRKHRKRLFPLCLAALLLAGLLLGGCTDRPDSAPSTQGGIELPIDSN